jgi:hypothetical protein
MRIIRLVRHDRLRRQAGVGLRHALFGLDLAQPRCRGQVDVARRGGVAVQRLQTDIVVALLADVRLIGVHLRRQHRLALIERGEFTT